jgi:hypothetical protein
MNLLKEGTHVVGLTAQFKKRVMQTSNRNNISPLFCNKEATHTTSILQEKQEGGGVLYMTNCLRGVISPTYIV